MTEIARRHLGAEGIGYITEISCIESGTIIVEGMHRVVVVIEIIKQHIRRNDGVNAFLITVF